jgi:hypothetical protein
MASTYSSNLKIELMSTGENSGTWGTTTNTNLGTALEQAVVGYGNPDYLSDANLTITITNTNAAQAARALVLNVTSSFGSLSTTRELVVPTIQKQYIVQNNTTGGQSILVKTSGGTGITVPNGRKAHLYVDGTNVIQMFDFVDINGGTIDGTAIGGAAAAAAAFTTLTASGATTLNGAVALGDAVGDLITVPGTINSTLLFTDNSFDIGASGANRPRNLFLAGAATIGGNLSVGGTLTLTGGVNLNGNVTVGDAATDTLTINSTITSNLIFTDNTYDIGASGATRPRNLFLAGNITAGGSQTLTGSLTVDSTTDSSSITTGSIQTDGGLGVAKALFVGTTANIAGNVTLDGGTANGVAFLNGSKVLTTGSALTFDGTTLGTTGALRVDGNVTLGDASTDTVQVNGYMGVGGAPSAARGLLITGSTMTGSTQIGLDASVTGSATGTSLIAAVNGTPTTIASAFTVTDLIGLRAGEVVKGAGSTITNKHGVYIGDQTQGTNNFGITSLVSSGTNKWNIYASGTAANYFAGNVQFAAGSAAAPALTRFGDDNTGIFFPAADTIAFAEGGAEAMRIDSAGNVGIGTSTVLDGRLNVVVDGTSLIGVQTYRAVNVTAAGYQALSMAMNNASGTPVTYGSIVPNITSNTAGAHSGSVSIYTTNTGTLAERLRIDSAGFVGIGTSSPSTRLQVSGTARATVFNSSVITTASLAQNATETLFTAGSGEVYMVTIRASADNPDWRGVFYVYGRFGTSATIVQVFAPNSLTLTNPSGTNVVLTNTSATTTAFVASVLRLL